LAENNSGQVRGYLAITTAGPDDRMHRKVLLQRLVKGERQYPCIVRTRMTANHIDRFAIALAPGNCVTPLVFDILAADFHRDQPVARFR
jgi:hypothetical protein